MGPLLSGNLCAPRPNSQRNQRPSVFSVYDRAFQEDRKTGPILPEHQKRNHDDSRGDLEREKWASKRHAIPAFGSK